MTDAEMRATTAVLRDATFQLCQVATRLKARSHGKVTGPDGLEVYGAPADEALTLKLLSEVRALHDRVGAVLADVTPRWL